MEAIRPSLTSAPAPTDPAIALDDVLPLPPAPFPVDLLAAHRVAVPSASAAGPAPTAAEPAETSTPVNIDLANVQRSCVHALTLLVPENDDGAAPSLSDADTQLASTLSELLEVSYELETFPSATASAPPTALGTDLHASYAALITHLSDLYDAAQRRPLSARPEASALHPAISVVRQELAWARIETLSHAVTELIRQARAGDAQSVRSLDPFSDEPPTYSRFQLEPSHNSDSAPPGYDHAGAGKPSSKAEKEAGEPADAPPHSEKMMRELDAVMTAIERLHHAAPQLSDQRSELRPAASTSARVGSEAESSRAHMLRERDKMRELEEIWDKIERAHGRRRNRDDKGQRVDGAAMSERRLMKRNEFLQELVDRAEAGRLQAQDSVMGERRSVDADLAQARELRDRDQFLRELVEQSADSRLANQDAHLNANSATLGERRQAFLADLMAKTRAGRLDGQDFPASVEDRLAQRRERFYENIVDYSGSGRLHGQDSAPPTPKTATAGEANPFELVTVQDFLCTVSANGDAKAASPAPRSTRMETSSSGDSIGAGRSRSNSVGAFRKIKGMVRRSSLGLGLKGLGTIDANSVLYIAEHQENLNAVQVIVYGAGVATNTEFVVEVMTETDAAISSKKDSSLNIPLTLPTAVHACQNVPLTQADMCLEAKLSAVPLPPTPPQLNSAITHALSAPELRAILPRAICCTSCDREVAGVALASTNPEFGYKDLPSEHWAEMMEVWMCHQDAEFTKRLAERTRDGFWPTKGQVLVGGSYLLVEEGAVKRANLSVHESAQADAWQVVQCSCGEVLGKQRPCDNKPGAGAVRLSKWAIAVLCEDDEGDRVEPVRFPLSAFLVSDMLELSQAHASYRFLITDEETSDRRVALWLFNPSVRIAYRRPTALSSPAPSPLRTGFTDRGATPSVESRRSSVGSTASLLAAGPAGATVRSLRAAKIMYKVLDAGDADETLAALPGFGVGGQVEELFYSRATCGRLVLALQDSTAVYPLSRRTMGAFDVGFLERF
ncbi:hypothetical protein Q5752_005586 [Cryptotrichosporon argae]